MRERIAEVEAPLFGESFGDTETFGALSDSDKLNRLKQRTSTLASVLDELVEDAPTERTTEWAVFADLPLRQYREEVDDMIQPLNVTPEDLLAAVS